MAGGKKYVASLAFRYGRHQLSRGQVIELEGAPNDPRLLRLEYLKPLERNTTTHTCGSCGSEFIGTGELRLHGDRWHARLSPEQEDALDEKEQRFLDQTKPIATERAAGVAA